MADRHFNEHYFAETAKRLGVDLKRFNKPNFSQNPKSGPKTLNKNYVYAISKSKQFMQDLAVVLERHFESEMRDIITRQICVMVEKWEAQLEKSSNRGQTLTMIRDHTLHTVKLKMPWTIKEILNAKEHTVEILASHR